MNKHHRSSKTEQRCRVCNANPFKYTCSVCFVVYCSVACYKQHKAESCSTDNPISGKDKVGHDASVEEVELTDKGEETLDEPTPLRPLTSLKWPYIPDESAYPDPLKRDDPKTLKLHQYEAIGKPRSVIHPLQPVWQPFSLLSATSPAIREILAAHQNLPALLTSIDKLRGPDREIALQQALGVTAPEIDDQLHPTQPTEDMLALRKLAESIENAVRGGDQSALGLDWGEWMPHLYFLIQFRIFLNNVTTQENTIIHAVLNTSH